MRSVIVGLLRFYKYFISPVLGNHCRFYPSCSTYAMEAITVHGSVLGSWLTVKRLLKCHPFHEGGLDPVPEKLAYKNK